MKKIAIYIFFAALILNMSGCTAILKREYTVISPHVEQKTEEIGGGDAELLAKNFSELKNAILRLVSNGESNGIIGLYNYSGDISSDISAACRDVMKTPIGAYAVDDIARDYTRIVSFYELTVDIEYKRTKSQIESVTRIYSIPEFEENFSAALAEFKNEFAVQLNYYDKSIYDAAEMLDRLYFAQPLYAQGIPELTVNVYPESGWQRIIEVLFEYEDDAENMANKAKELEDAAAEIIASLKSENTYSKCLELYDALVRTCRFDSETEKQLEEKEETYMSGDAYSGYGALVERRAVSEGYALAYKLLCDMAGIECIIIQGRVDGIPHSWNLVNIDESYRHADAAMDDKISGQHAYFFKTDDEFSATHKWNAELYP